VRAHVFSLRTAPIVYADLCTLPVLALLPGQGEFEAAVDLSRMDRLELELDDGRIVWKRTPSEALPGLLDALGAVIAENALLEPALPETLGRVREAMELRLESESDVDADTFDELVLQLCERLEGFSVWAHGVFDGLGRPLLELRDPCRPAVLETRAARSPRADPPPARPAPGPRVAETIARARVLGGLARRGLLEAAGPTPEAAAEIAALRVWAETEPLHGAHTSEEAALMALNPGAWSQRTLVEATWATESVVALAWALGLAEYPDDEEMVDSEPLQTLFGVGGPVPEALALARLRPATELHLRRDAARFVHAEALRALVGDATTMRFARQNIDHLNTVAALAASRLRALEWLTGS
jgi:hypothetical protein